MISPSVVIWETRKERSQSKKENVKRILLQIENSITELVNATTTNFNLAKHPFSQGDNIIKKKWWLVKVSLVNGQSWVNPLGGKEIKTEWTRLKEGWIKVNFDGAPKGNPGPSRVGVVAHDWKGKIVALGAQRLKDRTNNEAKAQAAYLVVDLANKLSISNLHLEGDTQIIINTIINGHSQIW